MKVNFTTLMLAAAALLASCSNDDTLQVTNDTEGSVPVTLSATIDHGVQTRDASSTTDDNATRCVLQIMEGTNLVENKEMISGADGSYTTSVMLDPTKNYTFLFWADGGDTYYNAENLEAVTIADGASGAGIAWYGSATWSSIENTEIKATLTHAVTKVTLQSTTEVSANTTATIKGVTEYSQFDVLAGSVSGNPTTSFTHSGNGSGSDGDVFSFYALVSDDTQTLTLQTEDQPEVSISNVPLAPNKHVILSGDVTNTGLTEFTFTATLTTSWGSTTTITSGYTYDSSANTYIVYTAEGLQAWASHVNAGNWGTNCTLAADIELTETGDWTPVGTGIYSGAYSGTFDGAGYTISGLTVSSSNDYIGFIGYSGGTVKNLHINATVTGNARSGYVGGIVGYNYGTIAGCSFSGSVEQTGKMAYAGGIVGYNRNKVIACCSAGTVKSTYAPEGGYAGGVVGYAANNSTTLSCYSTSTATGMTTGGVIGDAHSGATTTACYSGTNTDWTSAAETMNQALTEGNYKWLWETNAGTDAQTFPLIAVETE